MNRKHCTLQCKVLCYCLHMHHDEPDPRHRFVVTIHDVSPATGDVVLRQLDYLQPVLGPVMAAALIPHGPGPSWEGNPQLIARLASLERLLHGWSHHRDRGVDVASMLCGGVDEFTALDRNEAACRIRKGQRVLLDVFGKPAKGFLPPAWRKGPVDLTLLAAAGIHFGVGYFQARHHNGLSVPLATQNWDFGPLAFWGYGGNLAGRMLRLRSNSIPVLALHPCDEQRGFLHGARREIQRLLDNGYKPSTFADLMEPPP